MSKTETGGGWRHIFKSSLENFFKIDLIKMLYGLAVRPGTTITALALDKSYGKHWAFLTLAISVFFAWYNRLLPSYLLGGTIDAASDAATKSDLLLRQGLTIASIAAVTPPLYYFCRWLSGMQRSPASYLKATAISYGYWFLVNTALTSLLVLALLISPHLFAGPVPEWFVNGMIGAVPVVVYGSILVVATVVHKRFWEMPWVKGFCAGMVFLGLTRLLALPVANWIYNRYG
jgi:hypothetical protein